MTTSDDLEQLSRPGDVPRIRKCMTCSEPFESAWSGERICKRCKGSAAWKSGVDTFTAD